MCTIFYVLYIQMALVVVNKYPKTCEQIMASLDDWQIINSDKIETQLRYQG